MSDQRKNAGNIGDVIKHAVLPELVAIFDQHQQTEWVYYETHAGYFDYPLDLLRTRRGGDWSGERAWGIGLIRPQDHQTLGYYGQQLVLRLTQGVYPGSIALVDAVASPKVAIRGRDTGKEQVTSYEGKSPRIEVVEGDGYTITKGMPQTHRHVFCDPFWKDGKEFEKVQGLLACEEVVIVWYPLSTNTKKYREWQRKQPYSFIEVEFTDYQPKKGGWSGHGDMRGAGLTLKGLPPGAALRAREIGINLKSAFAGRAGSGRKFDLRVTLST
jgi:23S rRNA A2030 N6-methylase RlmJ